MNSKRLPASLLVALGLFAEEGCRAETCLSFVETDSSATTGSSEVSTSACLSPPFETTSESDTGPGTTAMTDSTTTGTGTDSDGGTTGGTDTGTTGGSDTDGSGSSTGDATTAGMAAAPPSREAVIQRFAHALPSDVLERLRGRSKSGSDMPD